MKRSLLRNTVSVPVFPVSASSAPSSSGSPSAAILPMSGGCFFVGANFFAGWVEALFGVNPGKIEIL